MESTIAFQSFVDPTRIDAASANRDLDELDLEERQRDATEMLKAVEEEDDDDMDEGIDYDAGGYHSMIGWRSVGNTPDIVMLVSPLLMHGCLQEYISMYLFLIAPIFLCFPDSLMIGQRVVHLHLKY